MTRLIPLMVLIAVAGCSSSNTEQGKADSLTRRQRDSLIGTLPIPGAAGVRGALKISDSAAARRQRQIEITSDSL